MEEINGKSISYSLGLYRIGIDWLLYKQYIMRFESWFRKPSGESEKRDDVKKDSGVKGGEKKSGADEDPGTRFGEDLKSDLAEGTERFNEARMREATSLSELREIIQANKITLKGSTGEEFGPNRLIDLIDDLISHEAGVTIKAFTRTAHFRDTVRVLAEKERVISKEEDS